MINPAVPGAIGNLAEIPSVKEPESEIRIRNNASITAAVEAVILAPKRSSSVPARGINKALARVPTIYADDIPTLVVCIAGIRWSVNTETPMVWPGMLASIPNDPATRITQP